MIHRAGSDPTPIRYEHSHDAVKQARIYSEGSRTWRFAKEVKRFGWVDTLFTFI